MYSLMGKMRFAFAGALLLFVIFSIGRQIYSEFTRYRRESSAIDQLEEIALPAIERIDTAGLAISDEPFEPVSDNYVWWISGDGFEDLPHHESRTYESNYSPACCN